MTSLSPPVVATLPAPPPSAAVLHDLPQQSLPGVAMFLLATLCIGVGVWTAHGLSKSSGGSQFWGLLFVPAALFIIAGLYTLQPNEAAILTFFGRYSGTNRDRGRWCRLLTSASTLAASIPGTSHSQRSSPTWLRA